MIEYYMVIGLVFGIIFLSGIFVTLWIQKARFKQMEKAMTKNMMLAIERLEWGEDRKK